MKHAYLFLFTIGLTISGISQSISEQNKLTGVIRADLESMLPGREVTVNIMDGIHYSDRLLELSGKLQAGVQKNYNWYVDQVKKMPGGQPVPYDKKLGLTKDEYTEFLELAKQIEVSSTGTETIIISKINGLFTFKSQNKLAILDSLSIDIISNTATFGQYKMPFEDTVNVSTDKNAFKSKWQGYKWRWEEPNNLNMDAFKDLDNLNAKIYKLTIGRLEKNGKTFMNLKGTEIEGGVKTIEFELLIQF